MAIKLDKVHININEECLQLFADWGSVKDEIHIARKICKLVDGFHEDSDADATIIDALVTAAIIRYVRCFHHTGKRARLKVDDLPDGLEGAHEYLKSIRDKHVAHSVNSFEKPYVEAYIETEDGVRKPIDKLLPGSERVVFNKKQAAALVVMLDELLHVVSRKMEAAHQDALTFVNNLEEGVIVGFKKYEPMNIDASKVGKARP